MNGICATYTDRICAAYLNSKGMTYVVGMRRYHSLIGRHVCLVTPYNDYWRSCQVVEEEETIEYLLCECNFFCIEKASQLLAEILLTISRRLHKKNFFTNKLN